MYNSYYAPYQRPIGYYNPSIPMSQEAANYQSNTQYQQAVQPQPMQSADLNWVLNETEAVSYPVAPNNSVTLWDKNKDTVYIKSVNMQGVPSIRILDYTERTTDNTPKTSHNQFSFDSSKFVCVDDFNALQGKIEALQSELNELKTKARPKMAKKEVSDDE